LTNRPDSRGSYKQRLLLSNREGLTDTTPARIKPISDSTDSLRRSAVLSGLIQDIFCILDALEELSDQLSLEGYVSCSGSAC
jgi:hypothetical protein